MMVSVICTVYNSGEYLERAIRSVIDQTYRDWELLILDDGSSDPLVAEVIQDLEIWHDSRITYERLTPSLEERAATVRYATNINYGAARTTGGLLTFLCGDDYYLPTRLERMVAKIEQAGSVVYGPQRLVNEAGREMGLRPAPGVLDDAWCRVDLNSVMVKREAFEAVGGFPDRPATPQLWRQADAEFWRRLTNAGYWFVPVDGVEPTDVKVFREQSVDARVIRGETPWVTA